MFAAPNNLIATMDIKLLGVGRTFHVQVIQTFFTRDTFKLCDESLSHAFAASR